MGFSKVELIREYIASIIPSCEVEVMETLYNKESQDLLLAGDPDFVVDCIDNTDTKADLITYCH